MCKGGWGNIQGSSWGHPTLLIEQLQKPQEQQPDQKHQPLRWRKLAGYGWILFHWKNLPSKWLKMLKHVRSKPRINHRPKKPHRPRNVSLCCACHDGLRFTKWSSPTFWVEEAAEHPIRNWIWLLAIFAMDSSHSDQVQLVLAKVVIVWQVQGQPQLDHKSSRVPTFGRGAPEPG